MLRALSLTVISAAVVFVSPAFGQSADLRPGQWTADMVMTVGETEFPNSHTSCMSAQEAALSLPELGRAFAGGADCTADVTRSDAAQAAFTMTCTAESSMERADLVIRRISDQALTLDGDVIIRSGQGQRVTARMQTAARYLGPCP